LIQLKAKFASTGITPVACGTIRRFPASEAEARALFDWAKDLSITILNAEPKPTDSAQLDLISRLCDEYQIHVGVHNHANPSTYWDPKTVLGVISGRSPRFGACGDTGHWSESGLIPANCLKQLAGHVKSLHLRNVATDKHLADIFAELKNQKFHGVISYEGGGKQAQQNVAEFVTALNAAASK
jgi:sugar phosphate isomerase/epimerase